MTRVRKMRWSRWISSPTLLKFKQEKSQRNSKCPGSSTISKPPTHWTTCVIFVARWPCTLAPTWRCVEFSLPVLKKELTNGFNGFPPGSISSFDRLTKKFLRNYSICIQKRRRIDILFEVTKWRDESSKDYVNRFETAFVRVEYPYQHLVLTTLVRDSLPIRQLSMNRSTMV